LPYNFKTICDGSAAEKIRYNTQAEEVKGIKIIGIPKDENRAAGEELLFEL